MATGIQNTTQKMSGQQIDSVLLKELECPVCREYMTSPIRMCENGHNVCGSCKDRLMFCPSCRRMFVNGRNFALENLAATAIFPCKNREAGCEETFTVNDKGNHLAECLFQSRGCPFRKLSGVDCKWTGTLSDIPVHIRAEHNSETAEVQGHFKVKLLNICRGMRCHQAVLLAGELFYLTWDTMGDAFSFGVFHFGPKNETEAFKYGIKIGNSEEYISITRKCHSYLEGGLKGLQPEKYVKLYYNTILNCLSESADLSCEIEIGREKLDGFVSEEIQEFIEVACDIYVGQGTAAGIAPRDGLQGPRMQFRLGEEFPNLSIPFLQATNPFMQPVTFLRPMGTPGVEWR